MCIRDSYYTKTVFEVITATPNGELTVCGGGRYDGLVQELGLSLIHISAVRKRKGMKASRLRRHPVDGP